jgi:TRAP-type C4-dicarboxylate transport system substrate-binding protein
VRASIALAALPALVALVASSCSGSKVDKVGGATGKRAVVLTLATHEQEGINGDADFAAAVRRLSRGSMRVDVRLSRLNDIEHERDTIRDVQAGRFDLAAVGVRVFDALGVTSFDALLAPFLVDSYPLERRVVESPLAGRMLAGVRRIHLEGVALVPGALRRPLGITRTLLEPSDFQGARIGIRPSRVAAATFRALGARPVSYLEGSLAGLDGAELDVWTIGSNAYDVHAKALTANVAFWPRTQAIVMNQRAFQRLSSGQRRILLEAGRATVVPELARLSRLRAGALVSICSNAKTALVTSSSADRAALRKAVEPVYRQLDRDADTKRFIALIQDLRPPASAAPACSPEQRAAAGNATSQIEGRWEWTWTRAELIRAGLAENDATKLAGHGSIEFKDGRLRSGGGLTGRYRVEGDLITLVFDPPGAPGAPPEDRFTLEWSVYRDRLRFAAVPGRDTLLALLITPFTRVH